VRDIFLKNYCLDKRSSGILLHITSLPGKSPNGELGDGAEEFCEYLQQAGQSWWQMLPIHPIGDGFSPYSSISSMAAEPLLICLKQWVTSGWLKSSEVSELKASGNKVSYAKAFRQKIPLWRLGFKRFQAQAATKDKNAFYKFRQDHAGWLDDFCMFSAIAKRWGTDWSKWAPELRDRDPEALAAVRDNFAEDINFYAFLQYAFDLQWKALRKKAGSTGIGLIGDVPIFVSHKSADVWSYQSAFLLNKDGTPKYVAGVPPDYFNRNGQLWGNALYDWQALKEDGFRWWMLRMERLFELFDVVRIDHFIGLHRYWQIPAKSKTAKSGQWKLSEGDALLKKITKRFGKGNLIAEDLGLVTPEVYALRDRYKIPGMRVLQFGFGTDGGGGFHLPFNYPEQSVAYSGTHDNDTFQGWFSEAKAKRKPRLFNEENVKATFGIEPMQASETAFRLLSFSPAMLTIFPMQDVLKQGRSARMNIPGVAKGNWQWRMESKAPNATALHLRKLAKASHRIP
jgi:4-alpha-glucanotransferase